MLEAAQDPSSYSRGYSRGSPGYSNGGVKEVQLFHVRGPKRAHVLTSSNEEVIMDGAAATNAAVATQAAKCCATAESEAESQQTSPAPSCRGRGRASTKTRGGAKSGRRPCPLGVESEARQERREEAGDRLCQLMLASQAAMHSFDMSSCIYMSDSTFVY